MPRRSLRLKGLGQRDISGGSILSFRTGTGYGIRQLTSCRKARALVGMDRLEEAREALVDGLQFEPSDKASSHMQIL